MNYLVTGAARGIGFETALALTSHPGAVVVGLSRNAAGLKSLSEASRGKTGRIITFSADLVSLTSGNVSEFLGSQGIDAIDGLVNNAGYLVNKPFENLSAEEFRNVYETNVFAPVRLIQHVMPFLKKSAGAHIINISSLGGYQGSSKFKGLSAYSSSKAAIACLSECLAVELAADRIAVNALALGSVDTEMLQLAFPGYKALVTAKDMGAFIADFLINGHRYFNGKTLPVSLAAQ